MSRNPRYNNDYHQGSGQYYQPSQTKKQLMSFQNYIRTLSNNIDEHTACKKYKDFTASLSQSKVGRFFDANKDREWFRLKYHPVESQKYLHQQNANFIKRLRIFNELYDKKYFDNLTYSTSSSNRVINLLDAIIVQLEDGPQQLIDQLLSDGDAKIDIQGREQFVPVKPTSVVINDISVETTISEIQDLCTQAHPDLLRIAQIDPHYVEGGHLKRKVIVTYKNNVDIKDVCWKLSRMKLNNRLIAVSVNRCLMKRIHPVGAITNNHLCIVNDIRNAIILILNFDEQKGLYGKRKQLLEGLDDSKENDIVMKIEPNSQDNNNPESLDNVAPLSPPGSDKSAAGDEDEKPFDVSSLDEDKEKEKKKLLEFRFNIEPSVHRQVSKLNKNKNPVLDGSYSYLMEFTQSSAAKYQQLKVPRDLQLEPITDDFDKIDADKLTVLEQIVENLSCTKEDSKRYLDRLLWYLRIVHSFDYYKKSIYRLEDELTLRMGVVHLRDDSVEPTEDRSAIEEYLLQTTKELQAFGLSQTQKYITKDEERYNYRSYGKVITDELTSYAQRIQKPKSTDTEEVYKCKHCTRVFQKLSDIGRHFVSKHRWAVDAIEVETDFFNAYLFDSTKIDPCPPKELLEAPPNKFARMTNFSQMGEDPDLLQQTIEAYSKMESFVKEPAPRAQVENDPRNESIVEYDDVSFDDAI